MSESSESHSAAIYHCKALVSIVEYAPHDFTCPNNPTRPYFCKLFQLLRECCIFSSAAPGHKGDVQPTDNDAEDESENDDSEVDESECGESAEDAGEADEDNAEADRKGPLRKAKTADKKNHYREGKARYKSKRISWKHPLDIEPKSDCYPSHTTCEKAQKLYQALKRQNRQKRQDSIQVFYSKLTLPDAVVKEQNDHGSSTLIQILERDTKKQANFNNTIRGLAALLLYETFIAAVERLEVRDTRAFAAKWKSARSVREAVQLGHKIMLLNSLDPGMGMLAVLAKNRLNRLPPAQAFCLVDLVGKDQELQALIPPKADFVIAHSRFTDWIARSCLKNPSPQVNASGSMQSKSRVIYNSSATPRREIVTTSSQINQLDVVQGPHVNLPADTAESCEATSETVAEKDRADYRPSQARQASAITSGTGPAAVGKGDRQRLSATYTTATNLTHEPRIQSGNKGRRGNTPQAEYNDGSALPCLRDYQDDITCVKRSHADFLETPSSSASGELDQDTVDSTMEQSDTEDSELSDPLEVFADKEGSSSISTGSQNTPQGNQHTQRVIDASYNDAQAKVVRTSNAAASTMTDSNLLQHQAVLAVNYPPARVGSTIIEGPSLATADPARAFLVGTPEVRAFATQVPHDAFRPNNTMATAVNINDVGRDTSGTDEPPVAISEQWLPGAHGQRIPIDEIESTSIRMPATLRAASVLRDNAGLNMPMEVGETAWLDGLHYDNTALNMPTQMEETVWLDGLHYDNAALNMDMDTPQWNGSFFQQNFLAIHSGP